MEKNTDDEMFSEIECQIRESLYIPEWVKRGEDFAKLCVYFKSRLCENRIKLDYVIKTFKKTNPEFCEKFFKDEFINLEIQIIRAHDSVIDSMEFNKMAFEVIP